jgi:hypothetical protein
VLYYEIVIMPLAYGRQNMLEYSVSDLNPKVDVASNQPISHP